MLSLDVRLLTNYYDLMVYNVSVNSKTAKVNESGDAEITYSIDEGKFTIKKISTNVDDVFDKEIFFH